ncbi:Protein CBG00967 [Caenorhabditis briggsae]|uniref:Protein CBG00967 n=1 Tax=Caenorhabditis briggsae TaxID=6238 RepID=A8WP79_CAEBR|nr:Protein CBG00967 [Caenorhabditis briggsae]CAP22285.2 Protein CBG00967 [Caenorhabditis briggsae]
MDPLVQHPELRPIKAHIPLRLKKVSIEGAKILINKDQLIVEIKDENIEVQALGKIVSTFAFSEETFQALASVLISSGQKVTEFVAWLWKSAKREQGVVTFEIYSKTFKEYKSNIRTWALTSYYKLQFGFPPRKVLCVDFHSKKQIAFTEHVGSSGNVRVSMCIEEKTRVDALFEMFGRLQGLVARWRRSGRPRERESK